MSLPPLPEPGMQEANPYLDLGPMDPHAGARLLTWFSPDQMHAYAAAAVEAERKQCALACVETGELASQMYGDGAECISTADLCADAIRARSKTCKP